MIRLHAGSMISSCSWFRQFLVQVGSMFMCQLVISNFHKQGQIHNVGPLQIIPLLFFLQSIWFINTQKNTCMKKRTLYCILNLNYLLILIPLKVPYSTVPVELLAWAEVVLGLKSQCLNKGISSITSWALSKMGKWILATDLLSNTDARDFFLIFFVFGLCCLSGSAGIRLWICSLPTFDSFQ